MIFPSLANAQPGFFTAESAESAEDKLRQRLTSDFAKNNFARDVPTDFFTDLNLSSAFSSEAGGEYEFSGLVLGSLWNDASKQISQKVGHFGALCNTTRPGAAKTNFGGRDCCPICPKTVWHDAPSAGHLGLSDANQSVVFAGPRISKAIVAGRDLCRLPTAAQAKPGRHRNQYPDGGGFGNLGHQAVGRGERIQGAPVGGCDE
jgi:hypothetical protein